VGDTRGQHFGLPGSGSRDDHEGAFDMLNSLALWLVQVCQVIHPLSVIYLKTVKLQIDGRIPKCKGPNGQMRAAGKPEPAATAVSASKQAMEIRQKSTDIRFYAAGGVKVFTAAAVFVARALRKAGW
jgi:hypothetical protein